MIRRLFTFLKLTSLGLCLVTALSAAVLWVRMPTRQDQFSYARAGGRLWVVGSREIGLYLTIINGWPNDEPPRLYGHDDPEAFIGPNIGIAGGTFWETLGVHGLYGNAHITLRSDGTAEWREHPAGVRAPEQTMLGYSWVVEPAGGSAAPAAVTWKWANGGGQVAPRVSITPPIFEVFVPHWIPVALFLPPPLAWAVLRWRRAVARRRRRRHGCCVRCGYDLRASSGRCPECGHEAGNDSPAAQPARLSVSTPVVIPGQQP